jgi:hypothetical protein
MRSMVEGPIAGAGGPSTAFGGSPLRELRSQAGLC